MVYVAFVVDIYSRAIVGWAAATHKRARLVLDAPANGAVAARPGRAPARAGPGASQRPGQYTSFAFTAHLIETAIDASIGTVGGALDNALMESTIGLYKTELIKLRGPWRTLADVELATAEYMDWFNTRRLHTAIGGVPPAEHEAAYHAQTQPDPEAGPKTEASTKPGAVQIRRDLVAAVAHELRTPIAVLQAGHEALLDGVAEPTPAELASLRDEVLRLARMVGDLQDLAAADAATLHLTRQPCDLAGLAAAAADSLTRRFDAAGIAVHRQLAAAPVRADPRWLHQVLTNLLSNALKFTPSGGRVTISTRKHGPDAVLEVTDTGLGIPADELPRVFDGFWRGRQAAQISGSGIGLSVAADLAHAHGGQLTAASQPGHGTTMTLTLPGA